MARRASSPTHPVWLLLVVALVIGAIAGGYVLYGRVSDPFRTMTALPIPDYLENANSLRGNVYKLEATVAKSLEWSPVAGRLFSVDVSGGDVLPLLVPVEFNHVNIERGQRFRFKIEVADKGVLRVQDVKKA